MSMQIQEASLSSNDFSIKQLWGKQHPLIHAWCIMNAFLIGFLYVVFFVI